ncbi:MAG: dienelactone hydrolase [Rhodothermales bacterium]|jgi:dienelactone hydrolase
MKQGINLWLLILVVATLPACELVSSGTSNEPGHQQGLVLPEATGAYTVGTASFVVVDADRDDEYTPEVDSRELNVKLWYPADQEGQGTVSYMNALVTDLFSVTQDYLPADEMTSTLATLDSRTRSGAPITSSIAQLPVVFWSHGLGGVNSLYTTFGSELASHGFLVVAIDHTYGAFATVFPDGTIRSIRTGSAAPEFPAMVRIWAKDMASVLDELELRNVNDPDGLLTGRIDLTRVGATGHSTGGSAAADVHTFDPRFTAAVTLDAPEVGEAAEGVGVDDPMMIFFAEGSEYASNAVADRLMAPGYMLTVSETSHYTFTDLPVLLELAGVPVAARNASGRPPGTLDAYRSNQIISAWSLAFFDRYLRGGPGELLDNTQGQYPEVVARRVGLFGGIVP